MSSDDDSDSTIVTVDGTSDGGNESDSDSGDGGLPSTSPSDGDDALQNITVSSATAEVPIGSTVTGSVTVENPHGENVTAEVTKWGLGDGCDVIALVDENAWGVSEYDLPAESEQVIEYRVNLTGADADRFEAGDSVTYTYDVDVPNGDDTEFRVTAKIVLPSLFPGLSITGPTGATSTRQTAAALVLVLAVVTGLAWRRWATP